MAAAVGRGGGVVVVVGGVAPDAHTPTLTNYHCAAENEEEVQTGGRR